MFNLDHNGANLMTSSASQTHTPKQTQEPAQGASSKACAVLFQLGQVMATQAAAAWLDRSCVFFPTLLARHIRGDWGNVDAEDAASNVAAVRCKARILSSYAIDGQDVWVLTEADRSATTILLPSDY